MSTNASDQGEHSLQPTQGQRSKAQHPLAPTSMLLRWRLAKTSGTAEEHDFDRFKAQLCSHFLTTDPIKNARDQLAELKQIKSSAKAYWSIFRTVALSVTDLTPTESRDRYLRRLKKHVRAQVLLEKPTITEDAMRLVDIYDPSVFGFPDKKHYRKPGT